MPERLVLVVRQDQDDQGVLMKTKYFFIFGSVAITIIGIFIVYTTTLKNENRREQQFRTTLVKREDIIVKVTESGAVEPVTTVKIKSELAGEVKELFVEEGDSVERGDKLALVQQESSQARQVAQAKASLKSAKLNLEEAERNLRRKRELYKKGFIAQKEVEDAEKSYNSNKIQVELAEKQLWLLLGETESIKTEDLASKTLDNIIVRSPISGVVINLNVEEGEMITSGTQAFGGGGTTIMAIADLSKMIVKVDINEVDIGKVKVGQPVQIGFDALKGKVYYGRVKKIAPAGTVKQNIVVYPVEVEILSSAPQRGQEAAPERKLPRERLFAQLSEKQRSLVRQEIQNLRQQGASRLEIRKLMQRRLKEFGVTPAEPPPPQKPVSQFKEGGSEELRLIKPGMTADLDIIVGQAKNVLCLPKEAIIKRGGHTLVMLIKGGETVLQPVITGLEDDIKVEIKEGLKEGDKVVVSAPGLQPQSSDGFKHLGGPPPPR